MKNALQFLFVAFWLFAIMYAHHLHSKVYGKKLMF
ncbi:Uncharacterised protein [Escherichia coli]|uniref:Uncharacterized protein n=1 Tax=Escherichia coli TaxID=562 RepID=A0A376KXJ4_ECOLX|nr:Uncharacterised protein [Escherichia coli]